MLSNKKLVFGITGGIAAYKTAELLRRSQDLGARIDVVMTESATRFISPVTFQALSGRTVYTDLWDARVPNNMAHIQLSRDADAILIAPASTNFMAKLANGLADDLLSTLCVARGHCPPADRPGHESGNVAAPGHPAQCRTTAPRRRAYSGPRQRRPGLW